MLKLGLLCLLVAVVVVAGRPQKKVQANDGVYMYVSGTRFRTLRRGNKWYLLMSTRAYTIHKRRNGKSFIRIRGRKYRVTRRRQARWMVQLARQLRSRYLYLNGKRYQARIVPRRGRFRSWPVYKRQIIRVNGKYHLVRTKVMRVGHSNKLIRYVTIGKKRSIVGLTRSHGHAYFGLRRIIRVLRVRGKVYRAIYVKSRNAWYVKFRGHVVRLVRQKRRRTTKGAKHIRYTKEYSYRGTRRL